MGGDAARGDSREKLTLMLDFFSCQLSSHPYISLQDDEIQKCRQTCIQVVYKSLSTSVTFMFSHHPGERGSVTNTWWFGAFSFIPFHFQGQSLDIFSSSVMCSRQNLNILWLTLNTAPSQQICDLAGFDYRGQLSSPLYLLVLWEISTMPCRADTTAAYFPTSYTRSLSKSVLSVCRGYPVICFVISNVDLLT